MDKRPPGFVFGMVGALLLGMLTSALLLPSLGVTSGAVIAVGGFLIGGLWWAALRKVFLTLGAARAARGGMKRAVRDGTDPVTLASIAAERGFPRHERRMALDALDESARDPAVVDTLLPLLRDLDVRAQAAEALGRIGDVRAMGPLMLSEQATKDSAASDSFQRAMAMLVQKDKDAAEAGVATYVAGLHAGVKRLAGRCELPVSAWSDCPMCEVDFVERTEHVAFCGRCGDYFCDPAWVPTVSWDSATLGSLTGEQQAGLYPSEMVKDLGFEPFAPLDGAHSTFPATLLFRLKEDPTSIVGQSLATHGVLMSKLASALVAAKAVQ